MFGKMSSFCAVMLTTSALAHQVQKPGRMRVNRGLIDMLFHNGDQKMLDAWDGIKIDEPVKSADESIGLNELSYSIVPKSVELDEYDFILSMKDEEYDGFFGVIGQDLMIKGSVLASDAAAPVDWWADITKFTVQVGETKETAMEILSLNKDALNYSMGKFDFQLGDINSNQDLSTEVKSMISEEAGKLAQSVMDGLRNSDPMTLEQLPVESMIPILALKYAGQFSTSMEFSKDYLEFGFDPEQTFGAHQPSAKKQAMLKEINSKFTDPAEDQDPQAVQFIFDENFFNTYLLEFAMIDSSLSLKTLLRMNPNTAAAANQLDTTIFQKVMPSVWEEYGRRKIDINLSMSHNLIKNHLEGVRMTGVAIDKNGNYRLTFNMNAQFLVDKTVMGLEEWESVRDLYISLTYKGKLVQKEKGRRSKILQVVHKSAEVSQVKVLGKGDEEMVVEQMMITSALNMQFEQIISHMKPKEFSMNTPPTPKEVQCLGFQFSDLTVGFNKGYIEFGAAYKTVSEKDEEVCDKFLSMLREGPSAFKDLAESMQEKQKLLMDHDEAVKETVTEAFQDYMAETRGSKDEDVIELDEPKRTQQEQDL